MGRVTLVHRQLPSISDLVINEDLTHDHHRDYISFEVLRSPSRSNPSLIRSAASSASLPPRPPISDSDRSVLSARIQESLSQTPFLGKSFPRYIITTPTSRVTLIEDPSIRGYVRLSDRDLPLPSDPYHHEGLTVTLSETGFRASYRHVTITNRYYRNDEETITFVGEVLLRVRNHDD